MIDPRKADIEYAAETKLLDLVEQACVSNKKAIKEDNFAQAGSIFYFLQALTFDDYLEDDQINNILECLKQTAELYDLPVSPLVNELDPPVINIGPPGQDGGTGPAGQDGGATDFEKLSITSNTVLDTFPLTSAYAARWDVIVNGTAQRAGTIWATWTEDGLTVDDSGEIGTPDVNGSTSGISLNVSIVGSDVRLNAVVTSGTWTVKGSRYFIPNNGAGTGPITNSLADGKIYIGDSSNIATAQSVSGDITITNTGVVSITANSILNTDVNSAAAIAMSKLAAMTASRAAVTDVSGFLTTSAATSTEVGYLSGVTSSIQTQLDSKLSAATGAISTVVSSNLTPNRLVISDPSGKIAVSGASDTEGSYLIGVTSAIQTQLNARVLDTGDTMTGALVNTTTIEAQGGIRTQASGDYIKIKIVDIGDWNMDSVSSVEISSGLTASKIRAVQVGIRRDDDSFLDMYPNGTASTSDGLTDLFVTVRQSNGNIFIERRTGGGYDSTTYNATGFNRGYITIIHIA